MTEQALPLFDLFTRLRQAGLPLGIDDYHLLLHALQAGFGAPDLNTLARLCQTLWIKSNDEVALFDYHFKEIMTQTTSSETSQAPISSSRQSERIPTSLAPSGTSSSRSASPSELTLNIGDEVQAARAILHASSGDDIPYSRFIQTDEYFPVTRRQMKQCWRYLRRPVREGPPVELDIEATVRDVGRQGMLLKPVFVPLRTNRAELLLLIDQGGSMVPFHALSRRLAETALRGGRLGRASIYYFRNCPVENMFRTPAFQEAEFIQDVLRRLRSAQAGVLIFSDAGAARGSFSQERYEMTQQFLLQLRQHVRYSAWLNPMPHQRWTNTTAGKIMQLIPMFEMSRRGLDNAINVLRGQPAPSIHSGARI